MAAVEEQFRRMALNIAARNQDNHVKNIAFLTNQQGGWALGPTYDMIYGYNTAGACESDTRRGANSNNALGGVCRHNEAN